MRNARIERVRVRKLESALQGSEEALEALEGLELNLDGLEPHLDGLDQTLQQETQGRVDAEMARVQERLKRLDDDIGASRSPPHGPRSYTSATYREWIWLGVIHPQPLAQVRHVYGHVLQGTDADRRRRCHKRLHFGEDLTAYPVLASRHGRAAVRALVPGILELDDGARLERLYAQDRRDCLVLHAAPQDRSVFPCNDHVKGDGTAAEIEVEGPVADVLQAQDDPYRIARPDSLRHLQAHSN